MTESDDVERKLNLRNTTNKRRRHGYESQTSSTGGGVRGRKTDWLLGMFEDTKIATWRSDEARRLPRDVRRTRGIRPKMIDCLRRSCEPCLHEQVRRRTTIASEDVVDCRACRHRTGIIIIIIIITSNFFTRSKSQPYRRIRGAV